MPAAFTRRDVVYAILGAFFLTNAILAEMIGGKLIHVAPEGFTILGGRPAATVGVFLWPVVFVTTDLINEYFGKRGVRFISWLAAALIAYAFLFAYVAIAITPADWWITSYRGQGIEDAQAAFAGIFGQGLWVIGGSLTAFMIGQLLDVAIYHRVRRVTGEGKVWLRATGSTLVSQAIDSFVVLYIAFVLGPQHWPMAQFLAVGTVNYAYKFCVALAMTPVIYLAHALIDRYLGAEAPALKAAAAADRGTW
jgi:uncharacterized integral membrane protein (TIGR00697 family)